MAKKTFSEIIKFVNAYVRHKYKEPIVNKEMGFPIEINDFIRKNF